MKVATSGSWASSDGVRRAMRSNRPKDTMPEVAVRSALQRAGLRFRKHYRPLKGVRCEVDVAFTRWRVAVLIDGCFWHGCPEHKTTRPATNAIWWSTKLDNNRARDRKNDELLAAAGWMVMRFWEHTRPDEVVVAVMASLASRRDAGPPHLTRSQVDGRSLGMAGPALFGGEQDSRPTTARVGV